MKQRPGQSRTSFQLHRSGQVRRCNSELNRTPQEGVKWRKWHYSDSVPKPWLRLLGESELKRMGRKAEMPVRRPLHQGKREGQEAGAGKCDEIEKNQTHPNLTPDHGAPWHKKSIILIKINYIH